MNLSFPLRSRRPLLSPLEKRLVDALADHLTAEARLLLSKQIEYFNFVRRDSDDKEVNFNHIERRKSVFDPTLLFPVAAEEVRLGRISFVTPDKPKPFRVDFWIVHGHLFSLEFNESPRGINADNIEIRDVRILADPMTPQAAEPRRSKEPEALTAWPGEWSRKWRLANLSEPLPEPQRCRILDQLDSTLPADYLELVGQTEGLEVQGSVVYGLSGVRSVVLPAANYYVLAEFADRGVLAVKQGQSDGRVYFVDYEGQEEEMGSSFHMAVERLLETRAA
jgi:hypothetical protein